jgi:hypothetical protein
MIHYPACSARPVIGIAGIRDRHQSESAIGIIGLGDRHQSESLIGITGMRRQSNNLLLLWLRLV